MTRQLNRLTAKKVANLTEPGRHADGGGLYLRITDVGARAWVFMTTTDGKRSEIGLGPLASISLAKARSIATDMREAVVEGKNPRDILKESSPEDATVATFGKFSDEYIGSIESGWKNPVHRQQWRNSLRDHAASLRDMPIANVATEHVLAVLRPIWTTKPETADRVRGRIERILNAAAASGLRDPDKRNPAEWRGHLELLLPKKQKLSRGHHAALPYREAPAFMVELRERPAVAARCLEFTILTAARSGEALGATWGEIDFKAKTWTVPKERMKAGVEHVVPLSDATIDLLTKLKPAKAVGRIFAVDGEARSNMAMSMLIRRMGRDGITTHGFRSTFRDWAGDETQFAREVVEQALAHTIQNKAERAYRRGTAIERRRPLMQAWAEFLSSATVPPGE